MYVCVAFEKYAAECILVVGCVGKVEIELAVFAGLCYGNSWANRGDELGKIDGETCENISRIRNEVVAEAYIVESSFEGNVIDSEP